MFAVNGFISAGEGDYWYDLASWTVTGSGPADARSWPSIGDRSFSGYEPERFWRNDGRRDVFDEVAADVGLATTATVAASSCFDYDDDGDLDLYVANQGRAPHCTATRRDPAVTGSAAPGRRPATGINRDAIGARVTVVTDAGRRSASVTAATAMRPERSAAAFRSRGGWSARACSRCAGPMAACRYLEDVAVDRTSRCDRTPRSTSGGWARPSVEAPTPRARRARRCRAGSRGSRSRARAPARRLERASKRDRPGHALAQRLPTARRPTTAYDRAIAFFEALVERTRATRPRVSSCPVAYVDKLPSRGGLAAIVSKGTLARKWLDQLDRARRPSPAPGPRYYARGMNHLHWPRALRHSDAAVADFRRCVELQRDAERAGGAPYYERTWVLLGDALAKDGSYAEARKVWQDGRSRYPASRELAERLGIEGDEAQLELVESRRSLERPIDTDFSFLPRD